MESLRILAIEDDLIHAAALKERVEDLGHLLIDTVGEIDEFKRLVLATKPDLLIMDIDLGMDKDGIMLAEEISKTNDIPFIFVTSYRDSETVLRAVETMPAAYVTKPVESASLQAAIALAKSNTKRSSLTVEETVKAFFLKSADRLVKVDLEKLLFAEAMNKQVSLQFETEEKQVTMKLSDLENQLPSHFVKVHRSFMVNLLHVSEIDPNYQFLYFESRKIPIGRSFKTALMGQLQKLGQ